MGGPVALTGDRERVRVIKLVGTLLILQNVLIACNPLRVAGNGVRSAMDGIEKGKASNPTKTAELRRQYYSTWPGSIQSAVDSHVVLAGMDGIQVQVAIDILESSIRKEMYGSTNGTTEIWHVWQYPGGWSAVKSGEYEVGIIFRDGKVDSVRRLLKANAPANAPRPAPTSANPGGWPNQPKGSW